jgi:hypothetical protein
VFPEKRKQPVSRLKKTEPKLKMSALYVYPRPVNTSGATYPGVPHLCLSCSLFGVNAASPKSAIFTSYSVLSSIDLIRMFSSLISQ